jgi:hypothetical protein
MTTYDWIAVGAATLSAAMPMVRLWLRLRFRSQFLRIAAALPDGSQVRESTADGTQFTVTVGDPARERER